MDLKELLLNRRNEIAFGVIMVAVLGGIVMYGYSQSNINTQSANYTTYANVTEPTENISVGLETGGGMKYGRLVEGTNLTKTLELASGNDTLTYVEVSTEGNISEYLHFDEEHLFQNNTDIGVKMEGRNQGYYTGDIFLDIKTASNMWGETWLEIIYRLP